MFSEKYPFAPYVQQVYRQLAALERLELPIPIQWTIEWETVRDMPADEARQFLVKANSFFRVLKGKSDCPAIYHFAVLPDESESIYNAFVKVKDASAEFRIHNGLKHPDFRNICHVPAQPADSSCLYVGSVKSKVGARILQHLGLTQSGRTGAMYLRQLLPLLPVVPTITVFAYFFEMPYVSLTEHIEYVFQTRLRPMLGKRSVVDLAASGDRPSGLA